MRHQARVLKRSYDTHLGHLHIRSGRDICALQEHLTRGRRKHACDDIDQSAFTRAVWAHQCSDVTSLNIERHGVESDEATEPHGDLLHLNVGGYRLNF